MRRLVGSCAAAVRSLHAAVSPEPGDAVVGLSVDQINRRFAAACAAAGLEGRRTSHGGRVGLAVELTARGASTHAIQLAGGWKDPAMVVRYAASVSTREGAVSKYLRSPGGSDRLAGARPTGQPVDEICQYLLSDMPAVNPKILVWARRTAGLKVKDAVTKLGITDTRLAALERGDRQPTRPILIKMARYYRRPLIAFYLSTPPPRGDRGADFRTLPEGRSSETEPLIDALIRDVRSRQSMVRATLEAEDETQPLPFVDTLSTRDTKAGLSGLRTMLGTTLTAADYYKEPTAQDAFARLRARAEVAGVFVLIKGNLGSHHTAIDVEVFRGFAIADAVAPFVIINEYDSPSAWSFTLLHELVHLLLGQTGLSAAEAGNATEQFCNQIAADWLLPIEELDELIRDQQLDIAEQTERIGAFARPRNLSHTMVAYRLLRAGHIRQQTFDRLRSSFGAQWQRERVRRTRSPQSEGGPNYYVVRRHRVGQALLGFGRRMLDSGALSMTKAAKILGVKPAQVDRLLRPARVL